MNEYNYAGALSVKVAHNCEVPLAPREPWAMQTQIDGRKSAMTEDAVGDATILYGHNLLVGMSNI